MNPFHHEMAKAIHADFLRLAIHFDVPNPDLYAKKCANICMGVVKTMNSVSQDDQERIEQQVKNL